MSNDLYIVSNVDNPIEKLSRKDVRDIFLGKQTRWSNNEHIMVADYNTKNKQRKIFSRGVLKMRPFRVYKIWIRNSLSGKTTPPKYFRDHNDLIDYVKHNIGAIGYLFDVKVKDQGLNYIKLDY